MATVNPFPALRPDVASAARICEMPYDVVSSEEARQLAGGNPLSFFHVSKPEIDLPQGCDAYAPEVYAKGRENFQRLIAQGALKQDSQPAFYIYRQVMGRHSQTGLVAVASCEDYRNNIILKHELTRPDKEDDRLRHIEALNSQTGPVFLVYRSGPTRLAEFVSEKSAAPPSVDFTATDGVRHSAWVISGQDDIRWIEAEVARIPRLYIADGHHRCAAAARFALLGAPASSPREMGLPADSAKTASSLISRAEPASTYQPRNYFLSVIFPHDQVQILPYNRVLRDLNGLSEDNLLVQLDGVFIIQPGGCPTPTRRHELGFYMAGKWRTLNFRPRFAATSDPIEKLDVTLLQRYVLDPIFGIRDPRTSSRLQFVGGIRGTGELEKMVNSGGYACAFSLYPTRIEDLMSVADAGGIMPPKSTWFEPKLRDAMFCHML